MFACLSPGFYGGGERSCMNITGTRSSSLSPLFFSFNCAGARVPSSWHTRHSASQRAIFLPEQTFLACFAKKKEEPFLQIEIRGGIVLRALKYPLKIWQRRRRGERVREKRGGKKMSLAHHLMVHLPWQTPLSWRERKRRRLIIIR